MAIKRKLLIPPESARPREAGWLDECRQRSFAALRACPENSEGMTALPFVGNPLADYDAYETEQEAEAHAPVFDLNDPEHRAALKESIFMVGR